MTDDKNIMEVPTVDYKRIYRAIKFLCELPGGNGSIEIHFVHGKIKAQHGLYIKPGIDDEALQKKEG